MKSLLIADTTREERERIVAESIGNVSGACDGCSPGLIDMYQDYIEGKNEDLFDIKYKFLQGDSMEGVVVGGNIRCLTKLAGTQFWPDMTGKILFLESLSGQCGPMATLFTQLELMGAFDQVAGVLLGTFTEYEQSGMELSIFDLLKMHISDDLPVAKTNEIGHGHDAKAIVIGQTRSFYKA